MKLNKKIISILTVATLVTASIVGIGVGVWYTQPKIKDLSLLIDKKDLGEIDQSDKNKDKLIQLIKEKNPNAKIDFNKLDFNILDDKVILKPNKNGLKTYKGEDEIIFKATTEKERNINKIKHIWNSEFKDRFFDESLVRPDEQRGFVKSLTNQVLLKSVTRRLKVHNLNLSISKGEDDIEDKVWNETVINHKHKTQTFKIKYEDQIISLPFGEFNKIGTKFKDDKFEEITEIGYVVSHNGLFTIFLFNIEELLQHGNSDDFKRSLKKVPENLPPMIESLSNAFLVCGAEKIEGIEKWDTSNITDMSLMFTGAENFNQDISGWDVSKVTNMSNMFSRTKKFNQNISNWDVSNVTNMEGMFYDAESFNQNISNWDVKKVEKHGLFISEKVR
ncbi:BspA family leucine-rich repeat surface protein [Mycoplasma yeatsii]|uniref:BspA family leucine-rich repeat surface protein n=1 Tax=Mycoplasma yeatsii TaxID=51365 RepID=UPI0005B239CD|nr:BspA family leucine-rich repeat surface protein [Mycoplasma yeatsii]AJM71939.1 PARCEL domain-containing protein [Mycoplasma yeatsii GM274B]